MRGLVALILGALLCLVMMAWLLPVKAQSGNLCGQRHIMIEAMAKKYQEFPVGIGIAGGANLFEVYASAKGTWTMLMTMGGRTSCVMATGDSWETVPPVVVGIEN